jgi:hypothetical protein
MDGRISRLIVSSQIEMLVARSNSAAPEDVHMWHTRRHEMVRIYAPSSTQRRIVPLKITVLYTDTIVGVCISPTGKSRDATLLQVSQLLGAIGQGECRTSHRDGLLTKRVVVRTARNCWFRLSKLASLHAFYHHRMCDAILARSATTQGVGQPQFAPV